MIYSIEITVDMTLGGGMKHEGLISHIFFILHLHCVKTLNLPYCFVFIFATILSATSF